MLGKLVFEAPPAEDPAPLAPPSVVSLDLRSLGAALLDASRTRRWYCHRPTLTLVEVRERPAERDTYYPYEADASFLRVRGISPKEQYRWMERFALQVEDAELAAQLSSSLGSKGSFQRFRAVLRTNDSALEQWQSFRSARLLAHVEAWLRQHELLMLALDSPARRDTLAVELQRARLETLAASLDRGELMALVTVGEFLRASILGRPA